MSEIATAIDITPNPRILQMLGEIDFQAWQCLAELIDNSIDSYLSATEDNENWLEESGRDSFLVNVSLPSKAEIDSGQARLMVQDTGPGMTLEQVTDSVRAGFSGNDPLGKLGLFGMGFNIATARLGRVTKIKTTRVGDPDWIVVELDLDQMQKKGTFSAKGSTEEKDDPLQHGTIVEIYRIKSEFIGALSSGRGRGAIKQKLSRIYSPILNNHPVRLEVGEAEIEPWRHCAWGEHRQAVLASGVKASAIVPIDYMLHESWFCKVCWHWSDPIWVKSTDCPACGSGNSLEKKQRHIHGWIGVQRYFDANHYGIDFVRNGRVIEELNKDCFTWWNPESETLETEYPIDATHWGGRIIGQINIDFAQVDYQKTAFSKDRNEWKQVITYLRGDGPLRPKIAEKGNYGDNDSPLAQLFKTFRYGRPPGLRSLVPGGADPSKGDNADASSWAEKFYKGEKAYLSDQKWWDRVIAAENFRRKDDENTEEVDENLEEIDTDLENPFEEDVEEEDEHQQDDENLDYLVLDSELSQKYSFPDAMTSVGSVEVVVYRDKRDLRRSELLRTPPLDIDDRAAPLNYRVVYNPKHPAFNEFAESPGDYLLIEISHWFSTRHGSREWPAGRVYQELKNEYQRSKKLDLNSLGLEAAALMSDLKEHLAYQHLTREAENLDSSLVQELTVDVMNTSGNIDELDELLRSGRWVERASDQHVLSLVADNPALVLDGMFFRTTYSDKRITDDIRKEIVDRIVGLLRDLTMIRKQSERNALPDKNLLMRAEAALSYLAKQRA